MESVRKTLETFSKPLQLGHLKDGCNILYITTFIENMYRIIALYKPVYNGTREKGTHVTLSTSIYNCCPIGDILGGIL